jgi:hypothetical protein
METCRSVPEAADLLSRTRHASPGIVVMADASAAVIAETTPCGVRVRDASAGVTGCTNHYLDPTLAHPNQPNEFRTLDRLAVLSKSSSVPRDVAGVWAALHAVHQDTMTIQTMVFEPSRRALHVAFGPGPATARKPLTMTFSTLFEETLVE